MASDKVIVRDKKAGTAAKLKYASLVILALQNATLILVMRYARTRPGDMFEPTTAVVCAEILKVIACLIIILVKEKRLTLCMKHLFENTILNPLDCLKISIPSVLYAIQNNLLYVALSNLNAATFQVTYQLKILTTALFSVAVLGKRLSRCQWLGLLILFVGVSFVQLEQGSHSESENKAVSNDKPVVAMIALLSACLLSGFAGVYFEKVLKGTPQSLWLRNVQMGVLGTITGLFAVYMKDGEVVLNKGFFFGYDWLVWVVIVIQSFGGLLVAVVVKYADNILKGFATSASIVLSCLTSVFLFNFIPTPMFMLGASLVMLSIFMYSKFTIK